MGAPVLYRGERCYHYRPVMLMPALELLLLNLKLLTVVVAGVLAMLAIRSFRRNAERSMQVMAAGLTAIGVGAIITYVGGMTVGTIPEVWVIESIFLLIGIGLILASVWVN